MGHRLKHRVAALNRRSYRVSQDLPADPSSREQSILQQVTALLNEVYEPKGVRIWLHAKHDWFEGRAAMDLIHEGRGDEVLDAAKTLVASAF
jgi:hypothetical protein